MTKRQTRLFFYVSTGICAAIFLALALSPLVDLIERARVAGRKLVRGRGCEACNWSGHRGRRAIFEIMPLSERLRQLILDEAPAQDLRAAAIGEGMRTLRQSGQLAVLDGNTTVEEVLRETLLES